MLALEYLSAVVNCKIVISLIIKLLNFDTLIIFEFFNLYCL